jgi:hypothetical protein
MMLTSTSMMEEKLSFPLIMYVTDSLVNSV